MRRNYLFIDYITWVCLHSDDELSEIMLTKICLFFELVELLLFPTTLKFLAGNALVTAQVFLVFTGGGNCLPLGDPSPCLPAYTLKKSPKQSIT